MIVLILKKVTYFFFYVTKQIPVKPAIKQAPLWRAQDKRTRKLLFRLRVHSNLWRESSYRADDDYYWIWQPLEAWHSRSRTNEKALKKIFLSEAATIHKYSCFYISRCVFCCITATKWTFKTEVSNNKSSSSTLLTSNDSHSQFDEGTGVEQLQTSMHFFMQCRKLPSGREFSVSRHWSLHSYPFHDNISSTLIPRKPWGSKRRWSIKFNPCVRHFLNFRESDHLLSCCEFLNKQMQNKELHSRKRVIYISF